MSEQDVRSALADYPDCLDCGRPYPHGLDFILSRKQWTEINPGVDGVLCPSCIVDRAAKLGASSVYGCIVKGEDYDQTHSLEAMLVALRLENADYCSETLQLRYETRELGKRVRELEAILRERNTVYVLAEAAK